MSKLQAAIESYKHLISPVFVNRTVSGVIPEENYQECKKILEDNDLLISFKDEKFEVEYTLPSADNELFSLDIDDLLKATSRQLAAPQTFYLADTDFLYESDTTGSIPGDIRNYLDASLFASTLLKLADHGITVSPSPKAIFLQGEKLELSLSYGSGDLKPLDDINKFIDDFVEAEIHKEQKITIIKGVLLEMLKNNEIDQLTLPCLIKRFSEFFERVNANYQLYVSEFSFEKIKAQFENEKLEFTLKLNKVFSDIQNQLLAVPVALILVGSQMELVDGFSVKNISIWAGSIVFAFFMSLLIRNQNSTLKAIKTEMESEWSGLESKHKFVSDRLGSHFSQLRMRYKTQRWFLMLVSAIIALSVVGSTALLLVNSKAINIYKDVFFFGIWGGIAYLIACFFWWACFKENS